jgi:hypothetical protein
VVDGQGGDQAALALSTRQQGEELAFRAEEGRGDALLERLRRESGALAEGEEGSERFLAIPIGFGHSEAPP